MVAGSSCLQLEKKKRRNAEKRLRLAEDSLKRLDKALRESGVKIDLEIETDVKNLRGVYVYVRMRDSSGVHPVWQQWGSLCGPTTSSLPHFPFVQCTSGGRKGVWLHEAKGGVAQQWNIGQVNFMSCY